MLQSFKIGAQNYSGSCSKVAQKNRKVAQKLLQNLNVPFHNYYKKIAYYATKEPFFIVP